MGRYIQTEFNLVKEFLNSYIQRSMGKQIKILHLREIVLKDWKSRVSRIGMQLSNETVMTAVLKQFHPKYRGDYELRIYSLLRDIEFIPEVYASVICHAQGRYWLLVEDLGKNSLDRNESSAYLLAAESIARMHHRLLNQIDNLVGGFPLRDLHSEWQKGCNTILSRLDIFFETEQSDIIDRDTWLSIRRVIEQFVPVMNRLAAGLPTAFIHGDLFPGNCFISEDGQTFKLIDWERAGVGFTFIDVAELAWWAEATGISSDEIFYRYIQYIPRECLPSNDMKENEKIFAHYHLQRLIQGIWDVVVSKNWLKRVVENDVRALFIIAKNLNIYPRHQSFYFV